MSRRISRYRTLNQELTQHSDTSMTSAIQSKSFSQRFGGDEEFSGNSPTTPMNYSRYEGGSGWPYPQHQRQAETSNQRIKILNKAGSSHGEGTPLPRQGLLAPSRFISTLRNPPESPQHPEEMKFSRDPFTPMRRDTTYQQGSAQRSFQNIRDYSETKDFAQREHSFDRDFMERDPQLRAIQQPSRLLNTEIDHDKLNSMLGFERVFYGGVDEALAWYPLLKDSPYPSAAVLFTITGYIESMVSREESQIVLMKGKSHVLQGLYYVIDRKLPHLSPSSIAVVTGNMTGARKMIVHDLYPLEEDTANLERMTYLSDRAVSRYIATLPSH